MPFLHSLSARRRRNLTYSLFLLLPVVLFVASYIYPTIYTLNLSLHDWDGLSPRQRFVGLDNYATLLAQTRFHNAVLNNIAWLAFYLIVPSLLGLGLALLVDGKLRGESLFKLAFFIPYIFTPVAVAAIWRWLYLPDGGLFNAVIAGLGFPDQIQNWLGDPAIVNLSVMLAALWSGTGFAFIVFLAGLRNIPYEYLEAARVDGASHWGIFWHIIVPQLWPSTILVVGIFGIDAMRLFDIIWSVTGGGPARASEVLATQLYDVAFGQFKMGMASAIGVCQLLLAALLILPYIIYITRRVEDLSE
ncbi:MULTISPECIES: carbohydrate ABC transporter permease [unclassified Brenneria]|uniref:carbohydrate ABC transporter permease n=1 Tax=unclassified Brenneria TaxID=2634434 RepID=UPI0015561CAC|nr:sugar ABC transporter permease [Brenneria sp. hezel4-2-4]MEE3651919.1 sugar ABC transporter permease [Brenneria sp. HEZEL_4_2_4]NPD01879.1 sugar ABC transporter permease [Brenneria sp. hezel4-2-4]